LAHIYAYGNEQVNFILKISDKLLLPQQYFDFVIFFAWDFTWDFGGSVSNGDFICNFD